MNLTQFKEMLSDMYNIDGDILPNLDAIIAKCVKKISEYYPYLESSYITSVIGTTRYAVEHDDLIRIKEVFFNSPSTTNPFSDPDLPSNAYGNTGSSLSQRFTNIMEHETRRRLNPVDARIVSWDTFDLIPTPSDANRVYYEYERYRTFPEIPPLFEDEMISLLMFYKNDESYQTSRGATGGNVFNFDRRGNISDDGGSESDNYDQHKTELDNIIKSIKTKANKLG